MSSNDNDFSIIIKLDFNEERINRILERRFKSNSSYVSYDYKSYRPEQVAINRKLNRSLLRFMPKKDENEDNDYEIISSSSSSSSSSFSTPASSEAEEEADEDEYYEQEHPRRRKTSRSFNNEFLENLAKWQPGTFRGIPENIQSDDEEEENENIFQSVQSSDSAEASPIENMDHSAETLISPVEDLIVTFEHRPVKVKTEPLVRNHDSVQNMFQLDGQVDVISRPMSSANEQPVSDYEAHYQETVAKFKAKPPKHQGIVRLHVLPPKPKRIRRENVRNSKPIAENSTKPASPTQRSPIKETPRKPKKKSKKLQPPLYQVVKKMNEDAIRADFPHVHPASHVPKVNEKPNHRISSTTHTPVSSKIQAPPSLRHSLSASASSSPIKKPDSSPSVSLNREKSVPGHLNTVTKKNDASKSILSKTPQVKNPSLPPSRSLMKIPKLSDKTRDSSNILQPRKLQLDRMDPSIERSMAQAKKMKMKELKRLGTSEKVDLLARPASSSDTKTKRNNENRHVILKKKPKRSSAVPMEIESANSDDRNCLPTTVRPSSPECIVIDDDDEDEEKEIEEIKKQSCSISYNIRIREEHLAETVRSSKMRTQWLINLEYLLLEHILICHDEIKSSDFYSINPKFICSIIETFVKKFLLPNASNDEEDFSLFQFGLTSHLRYFLLELPTNKHSDNDEFCSVCSTLNSSINDLFDLLFDLIELDLCETKEKTSFVSSWFNNEYFPKMSQSKSTGKCSTFRLKLVIYFIELISIYTRKCSRRKHFQLKINAKKSFRRFEDSISTLLHRNSIDDLDERLAMCFNIVELTLLFLDEKQQRIDEFSNFLTKFLDKNHRTCKMILFNKHLLVDIRLTIVNRLVKKQFQMEIFTMKNLNEFLEKLNSIEMKGTTNDESMLIVLRAFFDTFADFILETRNNSIIVDRFTKALDQLFMKILRISQQNGSFTESVVFFRLLRCRWNHL